jgi:hypothetical protein
LRDAYYTASPAAAATAAAIVAADAADAAATAVAVAAGAVSPAADGNGQGLIEGGDSNARSFDVVRLCCILLR